MARRKCDNCRDGDAKCSRCDGRGRIGGFPFIDIGSFECEDCGTSGTVTCTVCNGTGEIEDDD
jgi:DnaJ-class molecular chaperone